MAGVTLRSLRPAAAALALALAACAPAPAASGAPARAGDVATEAAAFMEGYARDLREGRREAIADRYDRRGAYFVGHGAKELSPHAAIFERYTTQWQPPGRFEWHDLSYEPLGPDAVTVVGRFLWVTQAGQELPFSYSALLVRQDGELRIRLEDESGNPTALAPPCPRDSTRGS
ncbi:MAG TPA: DUF4440 domain-containing protein [Longimicrobiaceae bacterium]|nr:DUF4440 domain-containing protein [Longimicrobiaceae bacterium]